MKYPCLLTKKINEISSAKYNPRKITDEAMGRLTKSLAEFGNIQPITWNVRTGNVVGGHQRLKVYKAMGKTEVDVWAVDLDEQKEKAANIALNKLSGEFDMPMLKDILEEIDTGDLDMEITGFGMDEIALMMEDAHPEITEDEVPEVPVDAITKPGDLWLLGEHRLLCGDSTDSDSVDKLMDGNKADIAFTSPPYNAGDNIRGKFYENDNDDKSNDEYVKFLYDFTINTLNNSKYSFVNLQILESNKYALIDYQYQLKDQIKDILIWNKKQYPPHINKGTFGCKWEYVFAFSYDSKGRSFPASWQGKFPNVIETENASGNDYAQIHKATFPIAFPSWILEKMDFAKSILDLFMGTGTTMVASHQLNRKCYGMEISPNYCDVIVKRWENLTGKKATLAK
jgi:DNA modification methylase